MIDIALKISKKNKYTTESNPNVGCVIANDHCILAYATTNHLGRPHAEELALSQIKSSDINEKTTIYSTLEPCIMRNIGTPCAENILSHNIKNIVFSIKDCDSRTFNRTKDYCNNNNINLTSGINSKDALTHHLSYFHNRLLKRPLITVKVAVSIDGKIALNNYYSKWISNDIARKISHQLRSDNDGILVGKNTFKYDNPRLNCRLEGLEEFSPIKIILGYDSGFSFKNHDKKEKKLYIVNENDCPNQHENIFFIKHSPYDIMGVLEKLTLMGIKTLLVEGGGKILTTLLRYNLIDKLIIMRSNKIIGNDGIGMFDCLSKNNMEKTNNFINTKTISIEDNRAEYYESSYLQNNFNSWLESYC